MIQYYVLEISKTFRDKIKLYLDYMVIKL